MLVTAVVAILVFLPIGFLFFGMFWSSAPGADGHFTTTHVTRALTDINSLSLLSNTLIFALGSTAMTLFVATALAWIVHRTDTPGRRVFDALPLLGLMFPSMIGDIAWIFLLSPRSGLINLSIMNSLGLDQPPFNIFSMGGMIWSQGLSLTPVAYLLIAGAFANMNPAFEEAATTSGARKFQILSRVTIPLLTPAILSTAALMFMIGIQSFETPAFIGLPGKVHVYMSAIYSSLIRSYPANYGLATAQSSVFLLLSVLSMVFYLRATRRLRRFAVITGRAYRPNVIKLGRWKYLTFAAFLVYLFTGLILPVITVTLVSFVPFYTVTAGNPFAQLSLQNYETLLNPRLTPIFSSAVVTSLTLGGSTGFVALAAALVLGYLVVRTNVSGRRIVEGIAMLPLSFPGMVFALALLWAFILIPTRLPGTFWILLIGYVIIFLPFAMRAVTNAFVQLHAELEEAARVSGAGWGETFRWVVLPLMKVSLINGFIFIFIQAYRQLGAAVLLVSPGTMVLPFLILSYWEEGQVTLLASAVVLYGGLLVFTVILARIFLKAKITV